MAGSATIQSLPVEIQALVLSKVNGQTLNNCRLVCKLWSELVFRLEVVDNAWMKCCQLEIHKGILSDILDVYMPKLQCICDVNKLPLSLIDWTCWKNIYGHYYRSKYVKDKPSAVTIFDLPTQYETVSCLDVCENEMFLGFEDGSVMCYDESAIMGLSSPVIVHRGTQAVDTIVAYRHRGTQGEGESITVISVHHTSAILVSRLGPTIDSTNKFCILNYHTKPITSMSRYGAYITTCSSDTCLQGQPIWRLQHNAPALFMCKLTGHVTNDITATQMWRNRVASVDRTGCVMLWQFDPTGCSHYLNKPDIILRVGTHVQTILYRHEVIICLAGVNREKNIFVHSEGIQTLHDVFGSLGHIPERMALHGSLLVIATEAALVYVYLLQEASDWTWLNLQSYDRCIKVDGQHITGLHIDDHGSGPVIIVTSDVHHLTIIHWEPVQEAAHV